MKYNTVEGDHCKDSQELNFLHVTGTINSQLSTVQEEEDFELRNDKIENRKDFRQKRIKEKIRDGKSKIKKLDNPKLKNNDKQKKKMKVKIKPHSSSMYETFMTKVTELDPDIALEAVEAIVVAFLLKARTSNLERALIVITKLLKTHFGVKYSDIIEKILLLKDMSFISNIRSWTLEELEIYMKDLLNNWKVAHKNEAFSSIVALISTIMAIFYSVDKKWTVTIGSFSMFLFDAKNSCKGATSLLDAILKVSTYVIGGLKQYVSSGTFSGFLYADDQLGELDALVSNLQAQFKYVKPGNLGRFTGSNENQFDQELQNAISAGQKLILLYDGPTKKFVMDRIRMLRQLHCDFTQTRATGGLRVAPFAYLLSGSTGLGKSSINEILMRYILASNGYNHQDQYIVTLNSQDKFYSTYRSYINGVILDDFANVSSNFVEDSPCDVLLKFVNNVPYYLNMAEIDLKGNVVAEPKVVGITTNVSDIDSSIYSNQPSSIMRRMKVHINAKVRPEFQKEGTIEIDSSKVQAKFGENALAPDIWLFDVYVVKVEAIDRPPKTDVGMLSVHRDDRWYLQYVQWNGRDMQGATINELLLYVKEASALHYKEQTALIERNKQFGGDIICTECAGFFEHCNCVSNLATASAKISEMLVVDSNADEIARTRQVQPHSSVERIYPELVRERSNNVEQSLKDMIFSWIVEGKYNMETFCSSFISTCNKELQYLLITFRKLIVRWFEKNRKFLIEMCFPAEFEGTRIGDYYSIVTRRSEVRYISLVCNVIETSYRIGLFSFAFSLHQSNRWFSPIKYLIPFAGQYFFSKVNLPLITTQIYAEGRSHLVSVRKICENLSKETICCSAFAFATLGGSLFGPKCVRGTSQMLTCALFSFSPIVFSAQKTSLYDAPRALSLLYKKEKEVLFNDWSKLAPAAVTLSTLYYSKDDIVDFYADACERWYMQPQSRLKPSPDEVEERDKKYRFDDAWFKDCAEPYLDPLPTSKLRTPDEVRNAIADNVWLVENTNTKSKSNCFVICSGCILIPHHFVPKVVNIFKFTRHNRGNQGNKSFEVYVDPKQCVRVKDYDLSMMWMPKTRDVKSLIDFFPLEFKETDKDRVGRIATRNLEGDLIWDNVKELFFTKSATSGLGYQFPGIFYIWKGAKEGTCLSPVITDDKRACISGLHIGGSLKCRSDGGFIAFGVTPTQSDLLETKSKLEKFASVLPMSNPGQFDMQCMGVDTLQRTIKRKSCYLRMENINSVLFLGSSFNCNRTPKSKVRDSPIKFKVMELFNIEQIWGSPKFKGADGHSPHEPWEISMCKWIVDKPGVPFGLLNKSKTDFMNGLVHVLYKDREYWSKEIRPLSWDETVNGVPGKRFIDSMNFKSSIGFPFKGSKKLFSENLGKVDGWQDKRTLHPEFMDEAERIESLYRSGERYYPWFTSTLKDEPTLSTKDKVRVFQATTTPFQLVMRKYTLGICRFLQMNPLVSECAVGIDPCSSEWAEMHKHLSGAQTPTYDRWFAIDYKAYDTSISSQIILAIGRIFSDIAHLVSYSEEDVTILNAIFTDLAFSIVDFNGDVLMLDGANPSGNSLTVFINNLCNSLLMRIYFYHLYPNSNFSKHVRMMCYGDDLIAGVSAFAGSFTMKGYAEFLKNFGFIVTPAQKDEQLKNYSKLQEIDFLKRKFVWSKDYKSIIAPLEEMSIYKRLCNYMSSDTSVEVIIGANIDGALDEWAFYGKEIYLDRQEKLKKIVDEFELHRFVSRLDLTYAQRVALWQQQNADPAVMGKGQSMDTDQSNCDTDWLGFFGWGNIISKIGIGGPPTSHNSGSISSDDQLSINKRTNNINNTFSLVDTKNSPVFGGLIPQHIEVVPHSSTFSTIKEEIIEMVDGSPNQIVDIPFQFDETRFASDSTDNDLGKFLSRPVKIHSFDWSPAATIFNSISPWGIFLTNKRVSNRLNNFKLFRGNLKLKFLINGNPFFYGKLMVSWWPLSLLDVITSNTSSAASLVQFSQMPRVILDPTTSQGAELSIPFFWHNDYLDMNSADVGNMGQLVYKTLTPLKHTSGDASVNTRVSISVYAWLEDVQLEGPTATNSSVLVPQSTQGVSAPSIPPYLMGSSISEKHPLEPNGQYIQPRGVSNMLLTDSHDTINKLTLTKEQQVSVDPRILGLGPEDEMLINKIASRESFLHSFNWSTSANREDLLWNVRVTPALWAANFETPYTRLQLTAACGAVLPFRYWNGTFKLRVQIVASSFHRGRLAVVYDPHSTATVREDNVAYTQIIDISECRDVVFKVGPNQDRALLSYELPSSITGTVYGATALGNSTTGNGTIAIYVLNELAIPNPLAGVNNDISINVFTSMDDDFEVYVPSSTFAQYTIVPNSTGVDTAVDSAVTIEVSEPYETTTLQLDQHNEKSLNRQKVFVGERILSFRELLKRYYHWTSIVHTGTAAAHQATVFTHKSFPGFRGNQPGAVHVTGAAAPYNYFAVTMLNYIAVAFQGWRGSIRYKIMPRTINPASAHHGTTKISTFPGALYSITHVAYDVSTASKTAATFLGDQGYVTKFKGSAVVQQHINPCVEYEVPWWESMRFCPGKVSNWTSVNASRNVPDNGAMLTIDSTSSTVPFDVYVSAGEDFSLHFFTGWPSLFVNTFYPAP